MLARHVVCQIWILSHAFDRADPLATVSLGLDRATFHALTPGYVDPTNIKLCSNGSIFRITIFVNLRLIEYHTCSMSMYKTLQLCGIHFIAKFSTAVA